MFLVVLAGKTAETQLHSCTSNECGTYTTDAGQCDSVLSNTFYLMVPNAGWWHDKISREKLHASNPLDEFGTEQHFHR